MVRLIPTTIPVGLAFTVLVIVAVLWPDMVEVFGEIVTVGRSVIPVAIVRQGEEATIFMVQYIPTVLAH